jgi:hypothetical protein
LNKNADRGDFFIGNYVPLTYRPIETEWLKMCRRMGLLIICLIFCSSAGPNKDAKLYIDFSINTDAIDSVGGCPVDSTVTAAIRINDASKLYSFQLYVKHDTSSLRFVSGKQGDDNLLEKNGGSIFFTAKYSIHDSTRILIGCTLIDNEPSQCVSDDGLLCLLNFRHKIDDTTMLSIDSVLVEDCDETPDTALQCFPGTIVTTDVHIAYSPGHPRGLPNVFVGRGIVNVDFGRRTEYVLTAVNTLGRMLYSNKGYSDKVSFDGRKKGPAACSSNLTVVRICYSGKELVVPLIR